MPRPMKGGRPPVNKNVLPRLLKMLFQFYPVMVPLTIVCIIFSCFSSGT